MQTLRIAPPDGGLLIAYGHLCVRWRNLGGVGTPVVGPCHTGLSAAMSSNGRRCQKAALGAPTEEIVPAHVIVSDEVEDSRPSYTLCSVAG